MGLREGPVVRSQGLLSQSPIHSFIHPNTAVRASAGLGGSGTPCSPGTEPLPSGSVSSGGRGRPGHGQRS